MDGLSKNLLREINITNLRTFLLPQGWMENRRYGFFISPAGKFPREQYWTSDPDKLILRRKIIFDEHHPYVPGMSTWEVIWEAPWEKLTFGPTGDIGVKSPRRRKTIEPIEQNATGTEPPADTSK